MDTQAAPTMTMTRRKPQCGDIVMDVNHWQKRRYALGDTGYLELNTGTWTPYDHHVITGPSFFERVDFVVLDLTDVTSTAATDAAVSAAASVPAASSAVSSVSSPAHTVFEAIEGVNRGAGLLAEAVTALAEAVTTLNMFHPAYDTASRALTVNENTPNPDSFWR